MTVAEELAGTVDELAPATDERVCAAEGCTNTFIPGKRGFASQRKYCDEHLSTPKKKKERAPRSQGTVNVNVRMPGGSKKKDDEIERVRDAANQLLTLVQILLLSIGQAADAGDVELHKRTVADAVAELARYEEWLRKLASGGETTARAMAWVGVVMAAIGMLVPILARHEVIPAHLAQMVGGVDVPQSVHVPTDPQPAAAPAGVA